MIAIILHGGVSSKNLPSTKIAQRKEILNKAVEEGFSLLCENKSSIDAVEKSINMLEESKLFNSGLGSVMQKDGYQRMDASIMTSDLEAGAVCSLKHIIHPISVARLIMEKTEHVFLDGDEAKKIALKHGIKTFKEHYKINEGDIKGTVGAVALDSEDNLCAGTSTGGLSRSLPGRIGDSAVIGAGTCCNSFGGVSLTGIGEDVIKTSLGVRILDRLENSKKKPELILRESIKFHNHQLNKKSLVGIILITKSGEIASAHNGKMMLIASKREN
ncbi:MAG: isoaspartyl peptidase/L-asparaginase family protein [Candidatus Helarchaeota archaeon]